MEGVRSERRGPVAILTLDRPDALNALDRATLAARIGLVNRVFPADDLLAGAVRAGEAIASCGPLAVARAKRVLQEGQGVDPRTAHALEQNAFGLIFASEDREEGLSAFLEKRDAAFRGR